MVQAGESGQNIGRDDKRAQAKYKRAVKELEDRGLLERLSAECLEVTDDGYLVADELAVGQEANPNG